MRRLHIVSPPLVGNLTGHATHSLPLTARREPQPLELAATEEYMDGFWARFS
jgi:hypothetical protein